MTKFFNKYSLRRLRSDQKGVSTVEFAIVIYPLLHIMIGIMNFGYAFYAYNTIQNVAIETAREYVAGGFTESEAIQYAKTEAEKFGGQFNVAVDKSQAGSVELVLTGDSAAFELVSFPYASLAQFRDEVTLKYRTTTYKLSPYS
ncbi:MAG: TadE family protein [Parasphingorhabdus sp.]